MNKNTVVWMVVFATIFILAVLGLFVQIDVDVHVQTNEAAAQTKFSDLETRPPFLYSEGNVGHNRSVLVTHFTIGKKECIAASRYKGGVGLQCWTLKDE